MRSYIAVTGALFALLVAAHIARVAFEGPQVLGDPFFTASTAVFTALGVWAWRLFQDSRPGGGSGT